jgi:predicted hydrocarbon binding protein
MVQPTQSLGAGSGPGNRVIATTLLERLAVQGRSAEGARALREVGLGAEALANASAWLPEDVVGRMFEAARVEPTLARTIGHRLVEPDATGLLLYGLGLATPEKAYRRIQALLPREGRTARWSIEEIREGRARLGFRASRAATSQGPGAAALCALRTGMLEGIPGLYGLLPARVQEHRCQARGADCCDYEIVWRRERSSGLLGGLAIGTGAAVGWLVASAALAADIAPSFWPPSRVLGALGLVVVGGAVGRCIDLTRQLQAVAGARRGQLALLDQADDLLASKIDAIARVEAKLEPGPPSRGSFASARRADGDAEPGRSGSAGHHDTIYAAALEIFMAAGELGQRFDGAGDGNGNGNDNDNGDAAEGAFRAGGGDAVAPRARLHQIRAWAGHIADEARPADAPARVLDLGALVTRAVAASKAELGSQAEIELAVAPALPPVAAEPVALEGVVGQLLRGAVESSAGLSDRPRVVLRLETAPGGVEISVEDRGVGIDSSRLDEVFDPFFGDGEGDGAAPPGRGSELDLPACLRIVERHGGEMRIEAGDRAGTRVTILLPVAGRGGHE